MDKTFAPAIDGLIALQKLINADETASLPGTGSSAVDQVLATQRLHSIDQNSATLRDRTMYALLILDLLEQRCEIVLQNAAGLMRLQRRLRKGANLASLLATVVVAAALAFGQLQVGQFAAILALIAIGVGMTSEYMIVTRKSDRVSPEAAHERLSQIVTQARTARVELQTLLRHDLATMGLGAAIGNANALCAKIMMESATLIMDPDGRASDESSVPVPLQA